MRFSKELYPKIALLKAAYAFTDRAYLHLDADEANYYVSLVAKEGAQTISEGDFENEMLCQSLRHEVYSQTKTIRELLMARAMASTVLITDGAQKTDLSGPVSTASAEIELETDVVEADEKEILSDWFNDADA